MDEREEVWGSLQEALPTRWTVGRAAYDPGGHAWPISAVGPHPGRGKLPIYVTGFGEDEVAAVRDRDARFPGLVSQRELDLSASSTRRQAVAGGEVESSPPTTSSTALSPRIECSTATTLPL